MGKIWKRLLICACIPVFVWGFRLFSDRQQLRRELIRFHVVANSDAPQDQAVKLRVRDAVLKSIRGDLLQVADMAAARSYLEENLPKIREIANHTLKTAGFSQEAAVTLCREAFDTRIYDTFALPSGVYESLRIVIGEGKGHNWWCVAFPNLCMSAVSETFSDVAAGAGFSAELTDTLADRETHQLRFFLLDVLGRGENILHGAE